MFTFLYMKLGTSMRKLIYSLYRKNPIGKEMSYITYFCSLYGYMMFTFIYMKLSLRYTIINQCEPNFNTAAIGYVIVNRDAGFQLHIVTCCQ